MTNKRHLVEMNFEAEAFEPAVLSGIVKAIQKARDRNERGPDELRNGTGRQTDTKTGMKPL